MSRLGLLWIVTRKCSHNLWDRERRQTETGGWHVMMWGVLTQLSTRLSTFTFYSKGCHPFRRQHSLSSRDRLTVNYLHFGYWNLIIIDNVSMKWSWMKFRCNITFHYSPLPSGGTNHTSRQLRPVLRSERERDGLKNVVFEVDTVCVRSAHTRGHSPDTWPGGRRGGEGADSRSISSMSCLS